MRSKRSREGELLIDHCASPGVTAEFVSALGLQALVVGAGQVYESAIVTCSHCEGTVVLNPQRTRPREYCATCDGYLCEGCAYLMHRTLECRPMARVLDELQDQAERGAVSPLLFPQVSI